MSVWKPGPPSCFMHFFQLKNVKLLNVHCYLLQDASNCCFCLIFFSIYCFVNHVSFLKCLWAGQTLLPCNCCVAQLNCGNLFFLSLLKGLRSRKLMIVYNHYYATSNKLCRDNICEVFFWRHLMDRALGLHSAKSLNWSGLSAREHSSSPSISIDGF